VRQIARFVTKNCSSRLFILYAGVLLVPSVFTVRNPYLPLQMRRTDGRRKRKIARYRLRSAPIIVYAPQRRLRVGLFVVSRVASVHYRPCGTTTIACGSARRRGVNTVNPESRCKSNTPKTSQLYPTRGDNLRDI